MGEDKTLDCSFSHLRREKKAIKCLYVHASILRRTIFHYCFQTSFESNSISGKIQMLRVCDHTPDMEFGKCRKTGTWKRYNSS